MRHGYYGMTVEESIALCKQHYAGYGDTTAGLKTQYSQLLSMAKDAYTKGDRDKAKAYYASAKVIKQQIDAITAAQTATAVQSAYTTAARAAQRAVISAQGQQAFAQPVDASATASATAAVEPAWKRYALPGLAVGLPLLLLLGVALAPRR